ncbi:unnamed protein product [Clonostachys rhizophaga]|uniref:Uncharacterized protein n=1 Tax=Clonostachys rhizophaga TaxID=160324 RepID=A0A9N9YIN0_9HYPO|nr:unnamed protein product [Clonostachys rhizophaga]
MFGARSLDLVPEYFGIPAEMPLDDGKLDPNNADGPFVLGTFLESLADPFEVLNGGPHRVEIPDGHVYICPQSLQNTVTFRDRHSTNHENPEIRFNCSVSSQLSVVSDTLETRYFDPEEFEFPGYICQSLDSEPIKKWLDGKQQAELYMITGVQVAKGLRATVTTKLDLGSRFGSDAKEIEHEIMPRMQNDVIVSYKATKYTLFRPSLLNLWKSRDFEHGGWMIRSEPVLVGDDYATAIKKFKERNGPILHVREQQTQ